jgi:hypothetical protein
MPALWMRWEARIVTWRGSPTASATGYRGACRWVHNWAGQFDTGTGPMYVRAAVDQGPAGTCAQPSPPESGCTAHGAVKSILSKSIISATASAVGLFLHYFIFFSFCLSGDCLSTFLIS